MRFRSPTRLFIAVSLALPFAVTSSGHAVGSNLAPNPGFELSPTDPSGATTHQPLIPTGWAFEGAGGLFDHSENGKNTGKRMVAISVPASTPREFCQQETCVDNPIHVAGDAASMNYSLTAYWRTVSAIPVTAGTTYRFSVFEARTLATDGVGGAVTKVRWVNATGLPISESAGPKRIQTAGDGDTSFADMARNVTAPAGATGAILFLGAADDLFISQIKFDDVFFGTA